MPNRKNMAARYANAHTRRDSRRRAEERARAGTIGSPALADGTTQSDDRRSELGGAAGQAIPLPSRPVQPALPRTTRQPVARPIGAGPVTPRMQAGRAPLRPTSHLASVVDYSYLAGDLRRIVLLSLSLFIVLVVLNLLLNH